MRITSDKVKIDYEKIKAHLETRAQKYNEQYPYVTTMYQDQNPQLTADRTLAETKKILPKLGLTSSSRVLDIGCGIGRWADAIEENIDYYFGTDYVEDFVKIARERNKQKKNFNFEAISALDLLDYYLQEHIQPFNCCIIAGVLVYLNDDDVEKLLNSLPKMLTPGARFFLREPMGVENRLTLKDFYSEELSHDYNAIYRSVNEYKALLLKNNKFDIVEADWLFEDKSFNNRKETRQYYFLLKLR